MRTYLDCYPCLLRQALHAARAAGADEVRQGAALRGAMQELMRVGVDDTPPAIADRIHRLVRQAVECADPYRSIKDESTRRALRLVPRLEAMIAQAGDPLDVALRLSIAGNIIDVAAAERYDLWATVERVLAQPYAIDHRPALRAAMTEARRPLYLADNAGETVFDRVLIERFDVAVTYAVKGGPILNDATMADALAAGLDRVAQVVSTGSDAPGTMLDRCAPEFRQSYRDADLIIAKGQANYETLARGDPRLFFLLQVKCPIIARELGVPTGGLVVHQASV